MATSQFEAQLETTGKHSASVYAAYLDVSGDPIPSEYRTLTIWYGLDPNFGNYQVATFTATQFSSMMAIWRNYELNGLDAGKTYYWIAWCGNLPTVYNSDSGEFTTEADTEVFECEVNDEGYFDVNIDAAYINLDGVDGKETLHFRYSTDPDFRTYDEETYSGRKMGDIITWYGKTLDGLSQDTLYYFLAWCGSIPTSGTSCYGSFRTEKVPTGGAYIYNNGWKSATPRIWDGSSWRIGLPVIED